MAMFWLDVLKMGRVTFLLLVPYGFQVSNVRFSSSKHSLIFIGSDDGFRCAFLLLIGVAFHKARLLLGISSSLPMVHPFIRSSLSGGLDVQCLEETLFLGSNFCTCHSITLVRIFGSSVRLVSSGCLVSSLSVRSFARLGGSLSVN